MFRSAATKIAHNSTIPALAGNQDLRPLQDLITAEKAVIISLQRLAADFSKAAEALKTWGLGEGDDLGNILGACTAIITHWTTAISQYASHGPIMREQLKTIRTREEHLDELRRRRRNLISKADSAEKKLQKMGPEHKNLVQQTDVLHRLRAEIGSLDVEIMSQEAAIGDFKRTATRSWMGLKFGGLLECCEKGVIVGEYGKLVVAEIPEEETQPGLPRNPYCAHSRIESLLGDTHRHVNEIRLSTVPSSTAQSRLQIPSLIEPTSLGTPFPANTRYQQYQQQSPTADSPYWNYDRQEPPNIGSGRTLDSPVDVAHPNPSFPSREPLYTGSLSNPSTALYLAGNLDEFGSSPGPADVPSTGGAASAGRFATFPVRSHNASASGVGPGYRVDTSPMRENESSSFSLLSTPSQREYSSSFTNSVNQALAATSGSHGQILSGQEYPGVGSIQQENRCDDEDELLPPPGRPGRLSKDGPAPSYELSVHDSPLLRGAGDRSLVDGGARGSDPGAGKSGLAHFDDGVISDDDDVETMSTHASPATYSHPVVNPTSSKPQVVHLHADRHVRFGVVSSIDSPDAPPAALPPVTPPELTFSTSGPLMTGEGITFASEGGEGHRDTARRLEMSSEEKEKLLNAAAAREIALELQAQTQFQPSSNARDRSPIPASLNLPDNGVGRTTDAPPLPPRERSRSPFGAENVNVNSLSNLDKPAGFVASRRVPVPPSPPSKDEQIEETSWWEIDGREEEEQMYNPYGETHARPQQPREEYESRYYGHKRKGENRAIQPMAITHEMYQDGPSGPRVESTSFNPGSGSGIGKQQEPLEQPNAPFMRSGMGANRTSSSLNGNGGGKVPAAVFKRPSPRLGSGSLISNSSLGQSQVSPGGDGDASTSLTTTMAMSGPGNGLQKQERKETRELDVDQYRYINAYVDAGGSGGDSSKGQYMNDSDGQKHGDGGEGYAQGKFTTNLEHEYDD